MSFARLVKDVSDVYVYYSDGFYICQWCSMHKTEDESFTCHSPRTMVQHLNYHRSRDDLVEAGAFDQLAGEYPIEATEEPMQGCDLSVRRVAAESPKPIATIKMETVIEGRTYAVGAQIHDLDKLPRMLKNLADSSQETILRILTLRDLG